MGAEAAARDSHGVGLRATPAVLRDSTRPLAEAEEQELRQEETERSVGATGELLTERTRDEATRTTGARSWARESGSASEDGGARDEGTSPVAGIGTTGSGGASRRACHARPRLPEWRARTAAQPGGGGTPRGS